MEISKIFIPTSTKTIKGSTLEHHNNFIGLLNQQSKKIKADSASHSLILANDCFCNLQELTKIINNNKEQADTSSN